jgi:hypothetical protein
MRIDGAAPQPEWTGRGRAEPVRGGGRPIGMVTVDLRKVFAAALLAGSLTTAVTGCGEQSPGTAHPANPSSSATTSRVAYFSSSAPARAGLHQVLHDQGELSRFAQDAVTQDQGTATKIAAVGESTDFSRDTLVGWTAATGCSTATAAHLKMAGSRLSLQVSQPKPAQECVRSFVVTVVFAVPKKAIPAEPVFG